MKIMFLNQSPQRPNTADSHERILALLRGYASPGTQLDLTYPDDFAGARVLEAMGDQNALSGLHHAMEVPALVRKIAWAAENGYDAVIQSNTFDPGVEAGRLAVAIPVIGLLRTALHVAATLASRIGIMVPLDGHVPYTWRLVTSYGMRDFVTGIRPVKIYGKTLASRREEVKERSIQVMKALIDETGAEIVLPLGGALIPYVVRPEELQDSIDAPILNTKAVAIRFTEMCVGLELRQSPLAYPVARLTAEDLGAHAFS